MAWVKGSAASRGYGSQHQKIRAAYIARWRPGDPCTRCGEPMWGPTSKIHLGHTDDRSGYVGLEHSSCNTADGARRGNADRPRVLFATNPRINPRCKTCGELYNYSGKQCMICGRHYHPSRGVQYTCSRACGVQYRRMKIAAVPPPACEVCGKSRPRSQRTCGREKCIAKLHARKRVQLQCEVCDKKFPGLTARYCSQNCRSIAYYYDNREEVLARLAAKKAGQSVTVNQSRAW